MRYFYRTFPITSVIEIMDALMATDLGFAPKDATLTMDQETTAIMETMKAGYRWIRTDNSQAIFELDLTCSDIPGAWTKK